MKEKKDVCVIIQARLGSQRIPRKMLRPLAGTTLTDIALNKIHKCTSFPNANFYFSSWEEELHQACKMHGLQIFERSEASAKSEGTPMATMYEWWDKLPYKYCVLISACAPFLKPETIDKFINHYLSSDSDGLFAVMRKKNYFCKLYLGLLDQYLFLV